MPKNAATMEHTTEFKVTFLFWTILKCKFCPYKGKPVGDIVDLINLINPSVIWKQERRVKQSSKGGSLVFGLQPGPDSTSVYVMQKYTDTDWGRFHQKEK